VGPNERAVDEEPAGAALAAGLAARRRGDYAEAQRLLEEAAHAARQTANALVGARAVVQLGVVASLRGDPGTASMLYRRGLEIQRRHGAEGEVAETLGWIGLLAVAEGDEEAGREPLEEALAIHRRRRDPVGEASALFRLGQLAWRVNDFERGADLTEAAIAIQRAQGVDRDLASSLVSLGFQYYLSGQNDRSEPLYREALAIRQRIQDRRGAAMAKVGVANALFLRRDTPPDPAAARQLVLEALVDLRSIGANAQRAWAAYVAGEIERHLNDYDAARAHAEESLEVYRELGDDLVAMPLFTLAELARVRHDAETAYVLGCEALRYARRVGTGLQIARSLELMAGVHRMRGDAQRSARLHGAAAHIRERIGLPITDVQRRTVAADQFALTAVLGEGGVRRDDEAGRLLTLDAAVTMALCGEDAPSSDKAPAGGPAFTVQVLGGFGVTRDGRPVPGVSGQVDQLVAALAVLGPLHTEELIELIWPEEDPGTGRRRLNNVLSRVRRTFGPLVDRPGEMVQLAAGTEIDAARFNQLSAEALARTDAPPTELRLLAERALASYGGDLLPGVRYLSWTVLPREQIRDRVLRLLDAVAAAAETQGDVGAAVDALQRASTIDPLDDSRLLRLADLALRWGRRSDAARALQRAEAVLRELGVAPTEQLTELRRRASRSA
jgi:DNA-binding SARP family transcriptional activator